MASGWMKSLQCKSKAADDVVTYNHHHHPSSRRRHHHHRSLSNASSCRNSYQSLKDIIETNKKPKPKKSKPPNHHHLSPPPPPFRRPVSRKPESGPNLSPPIIDSFFPSLKELPRDHPSRNVVEIIFHTSWGEKNFSGEIEMVFKVQNMSRTLTRFEEYRDAVKHQARCAAGAGAGEDHARCTADGNEVMRFYCLGATASGGAYESNGGAWAFQGCKRAAVCTYSGSGVAHENAGGGRGRRAMLVCRVIAGRVCKKLGSCSSIEEPMGYDSVAEEDGELLVFDTRALLPCFLIIYKL